MNNRYQTTFVLLSIVLLIGCTTISPKASHVQFHSQLSQALTGCKRIAPLSVTYTRLTATSDTMSIKLREAAADVGADTVVALNQDETLTEVTVQGIAFKCY